MWHLLLLALQTTSTAAQLIDSEIGVKFNCPNRETIDTAYFNYCPASVEVLGDLIGSAALAFYNADYTTQTQAFELDCAYGEAVFNSYAICRYLAGGGEAITPQDGNDNACPTLSQAIPQPSPGVNYRRRELASRAIVGTAPRYVCPFDSDNSGVFVTDAFIANGQFALDDGQSDLTDQDVLYQCGIQVAGSEFGGVTCFYGQDDQNVVNFIGSNVPELTEYCPMSVCPAYMTGISNMRRGIFREKPEALAKRQVNTKALRELLANKKRNDARLRLAN